MGTTNDDCGCTPEETPYKVTPKNPAFIVETQEESLCGSKTDPCAFNTPFYDVTLEGSTFVVPAVQGVVTIQVCNPSRWSVEQWVYIPGAGKFKIIGTNKNLQTLTIRNSCNDGSAIEGNAVPGTSVSSPVKVWLTDEPPCQDGGEFSEKVRNVLCDTENEIGINPLNATDDTDANLVAIQQECVNDCDDQPDTQICSFFRRFLDIIVKKTTMCFPSLPQIEADDSTESVSGTPTPIEDLVWMPSQGCLSRREMPARNSIGIYGPDGRLSLEIPADYADKNYVLTVDPDTGEVVWAPSANQAFLYADGVIGSGTTAFTIDLAAQYFAITGEAWPVNAIGVDIFVYAQQGGAGGATTWVLHAGGDGELEMKTFSETTSSNFRGHAYYSLDVVGTTLHVTMPASNESTGRNIDVKLVRVNVAI